MVHLVLFIGTVLADLLLLDKLSIPGLYDVAVSEDECKRMCIKNRNAYAYDMTYHYFKKYRLH